MNRIPAENGFQAFGAMWAVAANPGWLMIIGDYTTQNLPNILGILMDFEHCSCVRNILIFMTKQKETEPWLHVWYCSVEDGWSTSQFVHDLNATNPRSVENIQSTPPMAKIHGLSQKDSLKLTKNGFVWISNNVQFQFGYLKSLRLYIISIYCSLWFYIPFYPP